MVEQGTERNGWLTPPQSLDEEPAFPEDRATLLKRLVWVAGQILLILASFQVYKTVRKFGIREDPQIAFDHAVDVINFQESLGLFVEEGMQRWAIDRGEWFILIFNNLYAYYTWWVVGGMMVLAFFAPKRYQYIRRAFYISMLLVTPMYLLYPLAPPRFMNEVSGFGYSYDFVDTLAVWGPNYFSDTGIVQGNRHAAMPSMHCGWTVFSAIAFSLVFRSPKVRIAIIGFFAALILYIVIVTGNHYWIDGLVGWMFIAAAFVINRFIPYPLIKRYLASRNESTDVEIGRQSTS